ncbi:hypothetical protein [Planktotalea sp.]|uniref:hypothetical protein n=1 Tax=Planktotalea sp. TaxID=2029877 RepID=UPI0025DADC5F|nr:hypothetical protein [Planktotalea sp.]
MAWLLLTISGGLEVVWASALIASDGFIKPLYSAIVGEAASPLRLASAALIIVDLKLAEG